MSDDYEKESARLDRLAWQRELADLRTQLSAANEKLNKALNAGADEASAHAETGRQLQLAEERETKANERAEKAEATLVGLADANLARVDSDVDSIRRVQAEFVRLNEALAQVTKERDEARAELEKVRAQAAAWNVDQLAKLDQASAREGRATWLLREAVETMRIHGLAIEPIFDAALSDSNLSPTLELLRAAREVADSWEEDTPSVAKENRLIAARRKERGE